MPPVPHVIQTSEAPVLQGDGTETLACACGTSPLVLCYRPGSLLALRIRCFRCGAVTATPGLPPDQVLPPRIYSVKAEAVPLSRTVTLPAGVTLADAGEIDRADALARPANPARAPLAVADRLPEAVAAYDRLTGGSFAAHRQAVLERPDPAAWLPRHPMAWALMHLQAASARQAGHCMETDADSVAIAHLGAFLHFLACWSGHPLFATMTARAAAGGFSLHALAPFAAAKCLADGGNRVAFTAGAPMDEFALGPPGAEDTGVVVSRFDAFEWPFRQQLEAGTLAKAVREAVAAAHSRLNLRRPGVLVLSCGAAPAAFDQPVVDAIQAALHTAGRRARGVTAVAALLPKTIKLQRPDQAGFGWSFYPVPNSRPTAGRNVEIGARPEFPGLAGLESEAPGARDG